MFRWIPGGRLRAALRAVTTRRAAARGRGLVELRRAIAVETAVLAFEARLEARTTDERTTHLRWMFNP